MPRSDELLVFRGGRRLPRRPLRLFAEQIRRQVAGGGRFLCLLAGDRELRRLNRQFLGKDCPTDVLSFPEPGPDRFLGEIAISVDRARLQAVALGHTLEQEIQLLMLHGLLHLAGMDHATDRGRMARAETRWRKKLGLPSGLIERARS
ncbi:MAG: rRNA maturation RNase YbeY [Bryobacteraceae bacterium]